MEKNENISNCVICEERFDCDALKIYTLKGEAVLVCRKCAKKEAENFDKCFICKNSRLLPEELGCFVVEGEHQLLCDSCAREHKVLDYTKRCDVCGKPHAYKNLSISSRDGESYRVCKPCSTCGLCGDIFEMVDLCHDVIPNGKGIVCAECARCAKCGIHDDPFAMVNYDEGEKTVFICASCAKCEACSKPDDPKLHLMNGYGELECESCSKLFVLNVGERPSKGGEIMDQIEKTLKFKLEKETKNTVKYNEIPAEGQPPIIGTLYVQKWFAGNATEIEVTVRKP